MFLILKFCYIRNFSIKSFNYFHLWAFDYLYFPWLQPYNSNKLEFQSTKCCFLGYRTIHKGYRCLDLVKGKIYIYISHHVIFDEYFFPFNFNHMITSIVSHNPASILNSFLNSYLNSAHLLIIFGLLIIVHSYITLKYSMSISGCFHDNNI